MTANTSPDQGKMILSRNKREGGYMGRIQYYGEKPGRRHMRSKMKPTKWGSIFLTLKARAKEARNV